MQRKVHGEKGRRRLHNKIMMMIMRISLHILFTLKKKADEVLVLYKSQQKKKKTKKVSVDVGCWCRLWSPIIKKTLLIQPCFQESVSASVCLYSSL